MFAGMSCSQGEQQSWYLDNGCSRHMTGDKELFVTLKTKEGGVVTFGDNGKGQIIGIDKVRLTPLTSLKNVLYEG